MNQQTTIATVTVIAFLVGVGTHSMSTKTAVENARREGFSEGYSRLANQIETPKGTQWATCGEKVIFVPKGKKAGC